METFDFAILGAYLVLLGGMTWYLRRTGTGSADFFLAGRSMGALPIGISVMVTTFSAVNYLALPGEVSSHGLYVIASFPAFFLAAWPVAKYWIPLFHKLGVVSVYSFLEERFGLGVRLLCSGIFLAWRLFWMAVALYASCRIMSLITNIDFYMLLLVCGIGAAAYSAIGGMKAVIWTDALQFCVLFGSIAMGIAISCGGTGFWEMLSATGQLRPFHPIDWKYISPNPFERITLWSGLLGTFVSFLTRFGGDQMVMQRYLAAKSPEAAKRGLWINAAASTISMSMLALFGLALAVFARKNGLSSSMPPAKIISAMAECFPPGAAGLLAAGLLAATMSSIDSGLNSCSAALTVDFQERLKWKKIHPGLLTCLFAAPVIASAGIILPAMHSSQSLFAILNKSVNAMGTPLLMVMLCALFWKNVRPGAVFHGTISGMIITIASGILIKGIALHYYAVISLLASFTCTAAINTALRIIQKKQ